VQRLKYIEMISDDDCDGLRLKNLVKKCLSDSSRQQPEIKLIVKIIKEIISSQTVRPDDSSISKKHGACHVNKQVYN